MVSTIQKLCEVLKEIGRPASIEDIADRAGVSIRTVRRWISEAEKLDLLIVKKIGNKFYYQLKYKTLDSYQNSIGKIYHLTKLDQIVDTIKILEEKKETLYKELQYVKERIQNDNPRELIKEVLDYIETEKYKLESETDRGEEFKRKLRKINRIHKFITHLLSSNGILDRVRSVEELKEDISEVKIVGSDASQDSLHLIWYLGEIPISLDLMIRSCAVCIGVYNDYEFKLEDVRRFPQVPLTAGESYVEDVSEKFSRIDEGEWSRISLNQMNYVHFRSDEEVLENMLGGIFFHDGRIIPPDISYIDFTSPHRKDILMKIFTKVITVRSTAIQHNVIYVGCVKEPHKGTEYEIFKLITEALLHKSGVRHSELSLIKDRLTETQLASLLLDSGQRSFLVRTNMRLAYLPTAEDIEKARKFAFEDEEYFRWYVDSLEAFDCYFFYVKPYIKSKTRVWPIRYEIDVKLPNIVDSANIVTHIVNKIAVPHSSVSTAPERFEIYVPNVIRYADTEARNWKDRMKTIIYEHLRAKLGR